MRKIILDLAVTLDGYIEGAHGEIDWCVMDDEMDFPGFLKGIDTIFYGRVSYDMWGNFQPDAAASEAEKALWAGVHSRKKYVFSRQPKVDANATFISSNFVEEVDKIRQLPGKDIWLYGGAGLIKSFIDHSLIDVYSLSVHPVVLGSGKPLFEDLKHRIGLHLMQVNRFKSGVVQLIYSSKKADG